MNSPSLMVTVSASGMAVTPRERRRETKKVAFMVAVLCVVCLCWVGVVDVRGIISLERWEL